jgi:hypothetical protein
MDRIIQSMENFLTTVPRFLASELGHGLVATAAAPPDGLETEETFADLEAALHQVQAARAQLDYQQPAQPQRDPADISFHQSEHPASPDNQGI